MKKQFVRMSVLASVILAAANVLPAAETNESASAVLQRDEVEQLKQMLQQMQENFARQQADQQKQIEALTQKLEALSKSPPVAVAGTNLSALPTALATAGEPAMLPEKIWAPTDPIRISKGNAYADIGLVGTFAAGGSTANDIEGPGGIEPGGHDPNQRGFSVQGVEMNIQGAVDPYFRGNANILFSIDSSGESYMELEEAWMETTSLPAGLTVRAGQFFSDFGRINSQHPHSWGFVDSPLVNARLLGPDGLRNPGVRASWLMPTPFYSELSLGIQNSQGETAASFRAGSGHSHGEEDDGVPFGFRHDDNNRGVKSLRDMLYTPRWAVSFDLNDRQTLVLGTSAAFGPNSSGASGDTTTQIYGVDAYWKWKPEKSEGGFPFVSWQTEAMIRRYQLGAFDWDENGNGAADADEIIDPATGLPANLRRETVMDWGFYSQWLYGFRKGWVAGFRVDYVNGDKGDYERMNLTMNGRPLGSDKLRDQRWRLSPNLTWLPSEFSKLRLQYNYDNRQNLGQDHSVWLQFEFSLGSHAAHKF